MNLECEKSKRQCLELQMMLNEEINKTKHNNNNNKEEEQTTVRIKEIISSFQHETNKKF